MALLPGGGQAQFVTVPEGLLMPIPKDMTFIQAAAIPEAWLTAFQLLHFVGERYICPFILPKQLIFLSITKSSPCCLYLNVVLQRTFSLSLYSCGSESSMPDTNPWILTPSPQCQPTLLITYLQGRIGKDGQFIFIWISQFESLNGLGWKGTRWSRSTPLPWTGTSSIKPKPWNYSYVFQTPENTSYF